MSRKHVVYIAIIPRLCGTLWATLNLVQHTKMEHVLGFCHSLNVFSGRSWGLGERAVLTMADLLVKIFVALDKRTAFFSRILLTQVLDQTL
ncbi:hypothetical protein RRF57_007731 [Xylaria bambusicola]|uniref:Secreted protein n=1 Tax=Xylaria bambusicola TaxID=326684 RepID=A0AAN7Z7Q6_9PEZI